MPTVLRDYMPVGFRGLVIAGLLAAFMASFSAMVNAGASYIVRDFWQPLLFPKASRRHQIIASYVATLALVAVGIIIGLQAESIRQVFDWIMMALGAAFAVPNVLRWYWWRINGWGYAGGTFMGLLAAVLVPFGPKIAAELVAAVPAAADLPLIPWLQNMHLVYVSFPSVLVASLVGTVVTTLLTQPTDRELLVTFYRNVRPFGVWRPIRDAARLSETEQSDPSESAALAMVNTILGGAAILGAYLAPMYLVGHWHQEAALSLGVAAAAIMLLYFTWYRTLPPRQCAENLNPQ